MTSTTNKTHEVALDRVDIIRRTADYVRGQLAHENSGHDWWHVYRVLQLAKRLADREGADRFIVELAALLHDIADWKFHDGDEEVGPRVAKAWLESLHVPQPICRQVADIIRRISFHGAGTASVTTTIEGKVVQDADRLDAIGAIGIARVFMYSGSRDREMYDPDVPPTMHATAEAYKANRSSAINHFYEKLLLLSERLNTDAARKIAKDRHEFMEQYLDRFSPSGVAKRR